MKRKSRKRRKKHLKRDYSTSIANREVALGAEQKSFLIRQALKDLDYRTVPEHRRIPRTLDGRVARIEMRESKRDPNRRFEMSPFVRKDKGKSVKAYFKDPKWVDECLRRRIRQQVLFATDKKVGKGDRIKNRKPSKYKVIC